MAFHSALDVGLRRARFKVEFCIESIQLEEIAMRLARRRTRAAITDLAEIDPALARSAGKLLLLRDSFGKFSCGRRKVVEHPVHPPACRCIGSIHNERKTLR